MLLIPPALLALALLASLLANGFMVYRWVTLIPLPYHWRTVRPLMAASYLGIFYSLFLPSSLGGDAVKWGLSLGSAVSKARLATSILIDRLVGLISATLLAFFGLIILLLGGHSLPGVINLGVGSIVVGVGVGMGGWFLLAWGAPTILKKLPLPTSMQEPSLLRVGLKPFFLALLIALVIQLALATVSAFVLWSMGIELGFLELLIINQLVAVISILPISLGGLGPTELSFVYLATLLGANEELVTTAMAVSVTLKLSSTLLAGGAGAWLRR